MMNLCLKEKRAAEREMDSSYPLSSSTFYFIICAGQGRAWFFCATFIQSNAICWRNSQSNSPPLRWRKVSICQQRQQLPTAAHRCGRWCYCASSLSMSQLILTSCIVSCRLRYEEFRYSFINWSTYFFSIQWRRVDVLCDAAGGRADLSSCV